MLDSYYMVSDPMVRGLSAVNEISRHDLEVTVETADCSVLSS